MKTTSNLNMILSIFPPGLRVKWTFFSIERNCLQLNVVELSEWLTDVALEHDQLIEKRPEP